MVNINVRELDRVYNNDNVYYRCHIKCDCNNRTKTFYHEKVMKADEELHFTDEELIQLFKSQPWDIKEMNYNVVIQEPEPQPEPEPEPQPEPEQDIEDDKISGFTDVELNEDEMELLKKLQQKRHT